MHHTSPQSLSILLVASGLPPEHVGGVEQHVGGLAHELRRRGHRVTLFGRSGSADHEQGTLLDSSWDGIPVTRVVYRWQGVDRLRDMYRVPLLDRAFAAFLARQRCDVVHVHHMTGISVGVLEQLHQAGVPTVHTLHDYWNLCPRGQMFHRDESRCETLDPARCGACLHDTFPFLMPSRRAEGRVGFHDEPLADDSAAAQSLHAGMRELLLLPQLLLTPAARTRQVFEAAGVPAGRIHVVPNGVDARLRAVPRTRSDRLRIGYLGTLLPSKGLHVLMEAFLRLPAERTELRIHGNAVPYHGDQGYLTRVFQRLPPDRHLHYGGPYRPEDLERILTDIDVLAVPALWHEAFGLTPREARMAGRPVVVADVGGLTEGVRDGETGFVVPPGDVAALAAALGRFLTEPRLLDQLGAPRPGEGRGFAEMTDDLLAVYRRLPLAAPQPGPRVTTLWAPDLDARAEVTRDAHGLLATPWRWHADRWQPAQDAAALRAPDLAQLLPALRHR